MIMKVTSNQSRRGFIKAAGLLSAGIALPAVAEESEPEKIVELPSRDAMPLDDTWDLTTLFADDNSWRQTYDELKSRLAEFKKFEGKLAAPAELLACFEFDDAVFMLMERITIYAYLKYSQDVANPKYQEMNGLAENLRAEALQATSFIRPEILEIDESLLNTIIRNEKLAAYRLKLDRILRRKPHTLGKDEEKLLAMTVEFSNTAQRTFGLLNNADLKFGTVKDETGRNIELSTGSFIVFMNSPDRNVRKTAFHQFYDGYKSLANTLGSLLGGSVQMDAFYAGARKHPSALDAALFNEEIPQTVYDNLVKGIRDSLPILYKYYDLRRRAMKLDDIHHYDTYIPILSDIKTNNSWEQAVETIAAAQKPLGEEYVAILTEGLTAKRWCDRYENKGKRSGAFCYGIFSAMPYIMMNYKPTVIDGMFTLAHEGGHAMHSYYSAKTQPFAYYKYVTFVAEVASTFNEDLLARHLLKNTDDKRMRAWIINRQIDSVRQTVFRQTMFAEFEQRTHEMVEAGKSLTMPVLREEYRKLLIDYFGPNFVVDDDLAYECLRVPHFYSAFYVYKYATGLIAAHALTERVVGGGDKERNDYLAFLSGGCSQTPLGLLRIAGVDMETPLPIESAMKRFARLVDELDDLL